jgi:alkylation response protein AidB-like acyl-CoA dehydrogenase
MTMIWVPRDAEGMEIVPIETMGGRETNHLYLTDCVAPADAVLGEVDRGWMQLMAGLNVERLILAATMLGIAQRAFDDALLYVKERRQFGRPIGSFQALQHRLADLATDLEAARLMTRWVATLTDEDPDRMLPLRLLVGVRHGAARPHLPGGDDLRRHVGDPAQHHRQDARSLSPPPDRIVGQRPNRSRSAPPIATDL